MVKTRARRPNAGNKMLALLQSTYQEDDFYKSAYGGGFNEVSYGRELLHYVYYMNDDSQSEAILNAFVFGSTLINICYPLFVRSFVENAFSSLIDCLCLPCRRFVAHCRLLVDPI